MLWSISLSGGYYYIQLTPKSATSNFTPSNASGSSSLNTLVPTLSKEYQKDIKETRQDEKFKCNIYYLEFYKNM